MGYFVIMNLFVAVVLDVYATSGASDAFAGMELYPGEEEMLATMDDVAVSDWTLPSSKSDVYDSMDSGAYHKAFSIYEIPREMLHSEVSRAQLQRLMDEDPTLPMLLRAEKAVDVIRRFKGTSDEQTQFSADVPPLKALQGQVFGQIDNLEKVKLDEDIPEVPEDMSNAITDVRNQFRLQLTSIIEATATLFEHLVDLTQAIDQVRENHLHVMENVRENS